MSPMPANARVTAKQRTSIHTRKHTRGESAIDTIRMLIPPLATRHNITQKKLRYVVVAPTTHQNWISDNASVRLNSFTTKNKKHINSNKKGQPPKKNPAVDLT
jgi:hypothetical protein